jgi:CheY-like chemotaxis protein
VCLKTFSLFTDRSRNREAEGEAVEMGRPMQSGEKLKILVVDDNPAVNDVLCQLCSFLGHKVVTAKNGAEGLALVRRDGEIALVFTDFRMPVMNGVEMLRRLKDLRSTIPVVLITGSMMEEDLGSERRGFDAVVSKPFELKTIAACIQQFFPDVNSSLGD